ncbi:MAG: isoprenyl transferase [Elusimicrobiota bacterium]
MKLPEIDNSRLPRHIAIIMDGNGRWAQKRRLPRIFGHRSGMKTVREIVESCADLKIEVLTLYAFSTENWSRPEKEISGLMTLLRRYLRSELKTMMKNNVRLKTIGDQSKFPEIISDELAKTVRETERNTGLILNLALNYGSRREIIGAVNKLIAGGAGKIDEEMLSDSLDTAGFPDPDLLIRTSGEMRISNFLLWQIAYAELYVTPVLWPDFRTKDLKEAIIEYQKRERRFGGLSKGSN